MLGLQMVLIDNSFWNEKMLFLHFFDDFFTIQFGTINYSLTSILPQATGCPVLLKTQLNYQFR